MPVQPFGHSLRLLESLGGQPAAEIGLTRLGLGMSP
jgi:hypothetical protein